MIEDGIRKIEELVESSRRTQILHLPGDPSHVNYVVNRDGSRERMVAEPGVRSVQLETIADLTKLATDHFDPKIRSNPEQQIITYSTNGVGGEVRLWFDCGQMRETAYVQLEPTEEFLYLLSRVNDPRVEVDDLVDALRLVLRKTFSDPHLIEQVSTLSFTDTDHQGVAVKRGSASIRASILKEVEKPADLPEEYQTLSVRKFANHDLDIRHRMECVLDPHPKSRRWFFRPTPDGMVEYEQAVQRHVRQVVQEGIGEAPIRLYHGSARAMPDVSGH
jgi:hypothetical protein